MPILLSVEDLWISYGDVTVVRGVSFEVLSGQLVSIVGSNSAGKTTLLNCLSGLLRKTKGSVKFDGLDITSSAAHQIVDAGLVQVPESRALFPNMTVKENLLTGALSPSTFIGRDQRMQELLEIFPILREKLDTHSCNLSGGQQQMVAILRALMARPRLLVLDEPSFGLSPLLVHELLTVVRSLTERGVTVLLVEQNVRHSLSLCDKGYVLEGGRIVSEGGGRQLLSDPNIINSYLGV